MKNVNNFSAAKGDETSLNSTDSDKKLEINNSSDPLLTVAQRKNELDQAKSRNITSSSSIDFPSNNFPRVRDTVKSLEKVSAKESTRS